MHSPTHTTSTLTVPGIEAERDRDTESGRETETQRHTHRERQTETEPQRETKGKSERLSSHHHAAKDNCSLLG